MNCPLYVSRDDGEMAVWECSRENCNFMITVQSGKAVRKAGCQKPMAALDKAHAEQNRRRPLLGDYVEGALKSLGVTQEGYRDFKAKFGLPPTCDCEARKIWLNELDKRFGLGDSLTKVISLFRG